MKKTVISIVILLLACSLFAEDLTIRQVDSSRLFTGSKLDCYFSATGASGQPIELSDEQLNGFEAFMYAGDEKFPAKVLGITQNKTSEKGTTFFLLLDNSGSMYLPIGKGQEGTRMDHAKRSIRAFLRDLENPRDRVGLALFNTNYTLLSPPSDQPLLLEEVLESVVKPTDDEAFTEIYYSLSKTVDIISRFNGRKAIVILSDGENRPFYPETGKLHPELGTDQVLPPEASLRLQQEEISLFVIHFSPEKEVALEQIALDTGGMIFNARDEEQLTSVYSTIQDGIASEYKVTLRIPFTFHEKPQIELILDNSSDKRTFAAPQVFGQPGKWPLYVLIPLFLLALGLWLLLWAVPWEKPAKQAELTQLPAGSGRALQKTVLISTGKTVIGGAPQADVTVVGNPQLRDSHATIIQDEKTGSYTLISDNEVMVNNQPVTTRILNPGDVINLEGTTVVFDAPQDDSKS